MSLSPTQAAAVKKTLTIGLPNGRSCSLGKYVEAWRALKAMPSTKLVGGFEHFAIPAGQILAKQRAGIHEQINRHIPSYGGGRKWSAEWWWPIWRAASELNTPRRVVRWVPAELMRRPSIRARVESYREY